MKNSHVVSKKALTAFTAKAQPSVTNLILDVSDLNADRIHYGVIAQPSPAGGRDAHSIEVSTSNGVRISRCFDDKLAKAGLKEGDEFLASFKEKNGYANVDKIYPRADLD